MRSHIAHIYLLVILLILLSLFGALYMRLIAEVRFARGDLEWAAFINPLSPKYQFLLGSSYLQRGWMKEAKAHLEKAFRAYPQDARVMNNLAIVYASSGEIGKARLMVFKAYMIHASSNTISDPIWENYERIRKMDDKIRLDKKGRKDGE